jgi:hypothetical protein
MGLQVSLMLVGVIYAGLVGALIGMALAGLLSHNACLAGTDAQCFGTGVVTDLFSCFGAGASPIPDYILSCGTMILDLAL